MWPLVKQAAAYVFLLCMVGSVLFLNTSAAVMPTEEVATFSYGKVQMWVNEFDAIDTPILHVGSSAPFTLEIGEVQYPAREYLPFGGSAYYSLEAHLPQESFVIKSSDHDYESVSVQVYDGHEVSGHTFRVQGQRD